MDEPRLELCDTVKPLAELLWKATQGQALQSAVAICIELTNQSKRVLAVERAWKCA